MEMGVELNWGLQTTPASDCHYLVTNPGRQDGIAAISGQLEVTDMSVVFQASYACYRIPNSSLTREQM